MVLEAGKSLTEVPVGSNPGEDSLSKATALTLHEAVRVCACVCL